MSSERRGQFTAKRVSLTTVVATVVLLVIASPCYAHSVHPIFWVLGPISLLGSLSSVWWFLALAATISINALLLSGVMRVGPFPSSLGRAALILPLSKVAETLPCLIHPDVVVGMGSDTLFMALVVLSVIFGTACTALSVWLLHRRARPTALRVLCLSCELEFATISGLYISTCALIRARLIR